MDDWAQIDSSTPSASKMAFIGPRLKVKMVPKLQLSNFQKMEREILTLVVWRVPRHDFFGSIMVWHIVRARPKLTLAHLALRCALETAKMVIKCYFLRVKKSPKNSKKSRTNFFGFFLFSMAQTLKNNIPNVISRQKLPMKLLKMAQIRISFWQITYWTQKVIWKNH